MQHAHLLDRVRETVKSAFVAQGLGSVNELCETILIREGFYCGRSFVCDGLRAVWFVEENLLKFFNRDNTLLFTQPACTDDCGQDAVAA
jgi:hypothetical protein